MAQKTSILNSELAVKILSAIASRTDGNYSTNLAEELDKSQPSISRVLTDLHDFGFIEKGKRGKVQYYNIDYEVIAEYWFQQIREKLEEKDRAHTVEELDENGEKTKRLAKNFFQEFLESASPNGMTVSRLLFSGFAYSFGNKMVENKDLLENNTFLRPALEGLRLYTEEKEFSQDICEAMDRSIKKLE